MRVFVYEFVTGGGWFQVDPDRAPEGSLRDEGAAMVRALASDFLLVPGIEVVCLADERLGSPHSPPVCVTTVSGRAAEREAFAKAVERADWTVLIAPEFSGHLAERAQWVPSARGRLLSPDHSFITLAANKQSTVDRLTQGGVPTPRGCTWSGDEALPEWLPLPWVVKPLDGAGSSDIRLVSTASELSALGVQRSCWRVEEFRKGLPASVSVLSGKSPVILPAARQFLTDDGRFCYQGGETPLPEAWQARASQLASGVLAAFPPTTGYFGIDLVLGNARDGEADCVIEVNPRLTTSYLGLRRTSRDNLAEAMLRIAMGEKVELQFNSEPVRFTATSSN